MVSSPGPSEYQAADIVAMGPVARIRLLAAGDPHLDRLLDELDDDTWLADRVAAAEDLDTPPDVLAVLAADPDPEVRALAARVAAQIGPPAACLRPALERSVRDDVPLVRAVASAALTSLDRE